MRLSANRVRKVVLSFGEKYAIFIGACLIYAYYLFLTLDLFSKTGEKTELLSLVMQFDSLLLLWGVVYVYVQLQKYRNVKIDGEEHQKSLLREFQQQQLKLASLDDISDMLNDRINNPLSMISLSAGSLREKTARDEELGKEVDKIESALKRVQEVMMGIQSYHTKKILKLSRELMDESMGTGSSESQEEHLP